MTPIDNMSSQTYCRGNWAKTPPHNDNAEEKYQRLQITPQDEEDQMQRILLSCQILWPNLTKNEEFVVLLIQGTYRPSSRPPYTLISTPTFISHDENAEDGIIYNLMVKKRRLDREPVFQEGQESMEQLYATEDWYYDSKEAVRDFDEELKKRAELVLSEELEGDMDVEILSS
jgi:hypothetical protein